MPDARAEGLEAVMAVEADGLVVLGVDDQREDGDLRARGADGRIGQQGAAQLLALEALIDGQSADPGDRNARVPGQLPGPCQPAMYFYPAAPPRPVISTQPSSRSLTSSASQGA